MRPSRGSCGRACFTCSARPKFSKPFKSLSAFSAASIESNSTNPKPRDRPPSRSQITRAELTKNPWSENNCRKPSFVTSGERFPTCNLVIHASLWVVSNKSASHLKAILYRNRSFGRAILSDPHRGHANALLPFPLHTVLLLHSEVGLGRPARGALLRLRWQNSWQERTCAMRET